VLLQLDKILANFDHLVRFVHRDFHRRRKALVNALTMSSVIVLLRQGCFCTTKSAVLECR